jgi:hypothetical protein
MNGFTLIKKLDLLTLTVLSYFFVRYIDRYPKLTLFQILVFTALLGFIFYDIMVKSKIGSVVIQVFCSLLWAFVTFNILPLDKLVNNELLWIIPMEIALCLFMLAIHGMDIRDTIKDYKKKKSELERKRAYDEARAKAQKARAQSQVDEYNRLAQEFEQFKTDAARRETEARRAAERTKRSNTYSYSSSYSQDTQSQYKRQNEQTSSASFDYSLFNGCNDRESLTKRYHQLMKTFHPDNANGDKDMTLKIQKAYEELQKKYV